MLVGIDHYIFYVVLVNLVLSDCGKIGQSII